MVEGIEDTGDHVGRTKRKNKLRFEASLVSQVKAQTSPCRSTSDPDRTGDS